MAADDGVLAAARVLVQGPGRPTGQIDRTRCAAGRAEGEIVHRRSELLRGGPGTCTREAGYEHIAGTREQCPELALGGPDHHEIAVRERYDPGGRIVEHRAELVEPHQLAAIREVPHEGFCATLVGLVERSAGEARNVKASGWVRCDAVDDIVGLTAELSAPERCAVIIKTGNEGVERVVAVLAGHGAHEAKSGSRQEDVAIWGKRRRGDDIEVVAPELPGPHAGAGGRERRDEHVLGVGDVRLAGVRAHRAKGGTRHHNVAPTGNDHTGSTVGDSGTDLARPLEDPGARVPRHECIGIAKCNAPEGTIG